mgnify:FL=1
MYFVHNEINRLNEILECSLFVNFVSQYLLILLFLFFTHRKRHYENIEIFNVFL